MDKIYCIAIALMVGASIGFPIGAFFARIPKDDFVDEWADENNWG